MGLAVAVALASAVCTTSTNAPAADEVSGTGKGIAGGALLGAEIGFLGLSAFGAKESWMYYTFPPLLAIGGGVGGLVIEQNSSPSVPLFMLAGGMALVIPTVVITLSANSKRPGNEDSTPSDATPADAGTANVKVNAGTPSTTTGTPSTTSGGGAASGSSTTTTPVPPKHKPDKTSSLHAPRSFALVSVDDSAFRVGVPGVTMKPAYTTTEIAKFGVAQRWEVHAPLLDVSF